MFDDTSNWNALADKRDYSAIAMAKLRYPKGTPRITFKRARYLFLSLLYRREVERMFLLFKMPQFKLLPAHHPELLDKPITPYLFSASSARERALMVEEHYHLMSALFPNLIQPIYIDDGIALGLYPSSSYRIRLGYHNTFRREGELDISIIDQNGKRLYSCAFSLSGTIHQPKILIGSVQGPDPSIANPQQIIKAMTKEAFGLRPKHLVVHTALIFAQLIGAHHVLAVKKDAHVFQARRFSKHHKAKLHADYDQLWSEFGAKEHDYNFVRLSLPGRKPLGEIDSNKRAMYRRRYQWLDTLADNISRIFVQQRNIPAAA
jgi:uncharacterized protein VirK/YbjX